MPAQTNPPPSIDGPRRFRFEWVALAAMLWLVAAIFGWMLVSDRVRVEALEGDRLQIQARVIDANVSRQLDGANKALESVRADLRQLDPAINGIAANDKLKSLTDAMPGVSAMLVLDARGIVAGASRDELIGIDLGERPYFRLPRGNPDPTVLYVSSPFQSVRGTFVVVVTRVITGRSGEFLGVVTASLDPEYFRAVLQSVLYAPDMRATLIDADGVVFLDVPAGHAALDLAAGDADAPFRSFQRSGTAFALSVGSPSDGAASMQALRTVSRGALQVDRPMVVAVSRELSVVTRPWREKAVEFALVFAALVAGLCLALFFSQRRRRAIDQVDTAVATERRSGAERLEFALNSARLGLWDLHVPTGRAVVNDRERELLGFETAEPLPEGGAWRRLIHPDDRAIVDAAMRRHLSGETASYACEHRIRHRDGTWRWVASRAMVVERDDGGGPSRMIGTHRDIGERKQADADLAHAAALLRDSEEQLRQVTDNMPALVSRLDSARRFRFANRAYRDWLQIEPASLIGRSLSEVYGESVYATFAQHIDAALAGEKVVYERELVTPTGTRRVEVMLIPQRDADGTVQSLYALMNDISARFQADRLRARSEERLSLALEGSGLALFDWDIANDRMFQSAQAAAMRGEVAEETTASAAQMRAGVHPDDLAQVLAQVADVVKGATSLYRAEFRIAHRDGTWTWVRAQGRVVERDARGRALRVAGTYSNIDDQKKAEAQLRRLAEVDDLTGLPNRAVFNERLAQSMLRASNVAPMALLFLDVDHFKKINDTLGHEAGDEVLKAFADRMREVVRPADTVARLAGDEFTIIVEGMRHAGDARRVAEKLVERLREPIVIGGRAVLVTASVGVTIGVPGESDPAAFLHRADLALYEAKRRGRDRYCCEGSAESSDVGPAAT